MSGNPPSPQKKQTKLDAMHEDTTHIMGFSITGTVVMLVNSSKPKGQIAPNLWSPTSALHITVGDFHIPIVLHEVL